MTNGTKVLQFPAAYDTQFCEALVRFDILLYTIVKIRTPDYYRIGL